MRHLACLSLLLVACTKDEPTSLGGLPTCGLAQIAVKTDTGYKCITLDSEFNSLARADLQCQDGEVVVYAGGRWSCGAPASIEGGDITAVRVSGGLKGGGDSGIVDVSVDFGSNGTANSVARSDHSHSWAELGGAPAGFADNIDNDSLGALSCMGGQVPVFDGASQTWTCATSTGGGGPLLENDPTVNDLGKADLSGCNAGQLVQRNGTHWACINTPVDNDTLALLAVACAEGQILVRGPAGFQCEFPVGSGGGSGDITAVNTAIGSGLTGGAAMGDANLAVNFAGGTCTSGQASCSDHTHPAASLSQVLTTGNAVGAGQTITNVPAPIANSDIVPKSYVDALAGGGGGGGATAIALCCGSVCDDSYAQSGWLCDDVGLLRDSSNNVVSTGNASDKITLFLPEKRGYISVPNTGAPTLYSPTGTATALQSCASEWRVCSKSNVTGLSYNCGSFGSMPITPQQWSCVNAPPAGYIFAPNTVGILKLIDSSNAEYQTDLATSFATPAAIGCSGATAPPVAPSVVSFVCTK